IRIQGSRGELVIRKPCKQLLQHVEIRLSLECEGGRIHKLPANDRAETPREDVCTYTPAPRAAEGRCPPPLPPRLFTLPACAFRQQQVRRESLIRTHQQG
ncbi:hypothetical protein cyc_08269, partial [Cyclospora cayetanensis]